MKNITSKQIFTSALIILFLLSHSLVYSLDFTVQKIISCSAGRNHTLAIDGSGNLWAWGNNSFGQLGDGTTTDVSVPLQIKPGTKFQFISAGYEHSLAIDESGILWGWGYNKYGQVGDGTKTDKSSPVQIKPDTKFRSVAAGGNHSLAIDETGQLWGWGENNSGQVGDGSALDRTTPVQILSVKKFQSVSAGGYHSLAIDEKGWLYAWGDNSSGQLGRGTYSKEYSPQFVQFYFNTKCQSISAGNSFSLAIDITGNLWGWGGNQYGQLGDGTNTGKTLPFQINPGTIFQTVTAGYSHTLAIDESGALWACGQNNKGQLGDGTTSERKSLVQIKPGVAFQSVSAGESHSLAIDEYGNCWSWGYFWYGQLGDATEIIRNKLVQIRPDTKYQSVSSGGTHTLAIDESGNLWAWGGNTFGQVGDGTTQTRYTPVQIKPDTRFIVVSAGEYHSLAIDESGYIWAWGRNESGQVGNGQYINKTSPVQIRPETKYKSVSAGGAHSMAIDVSDNLWGWGNNSHARVDYHLGATVPAPSRIYQGKKFQLADAGDSHTMVIDTEGALKPWGYNAYGQLGNGSITTSSSGDIVLAGTKFKTVSAGGDHTLAIDEAGNLYTWGRGTRGQLGNGNTYNYNADPEHINPDAKYASVSAADDQSMAIDEHGKLWAWGRNSGGLLGDGTNEDKLIPVPIKPDTEFLSVSAGSGHSMAIDESNNLWGWGSNESGQLGYGINWNEIPQWLNTGYIPIKVTSVTLSMADITIFKNDLIPLIAAVLPVNAATKRVIWLSSNSTIATVNLKGEVKALSSGTVTITATTSDGNKTATCLVTVISPVTSIYIQEVSFNMEKGKTSKIIAWVSPPDATVKTVTWSSSDPTVATVDSTGLVTSISSGDAMITATSTDGGKSDSCLVTVITHVSGISLSETSLTIQKDSAGQLTATVLPANATYKNISWWSSDTKVATVNSSGVVTGISPGIATISAVSTDGHKVADCIVTVISLVTGLTLSSDSITVHRDSTFRLTAMVAPEDATQKKVFWSSSDDAVAIVDSTGLVTGIKTGKAIITSTTKDGNISATCTITVVSFVTEITLSSETLTIQKGLTHQLTATVLPADATNPIVTWSSSDTSIATVDTTGLVTGIIIGTADISATTAYGSYTSTCVVTVEPNVSASFTDINSQLLVYPNPVKEGTLNISLNNQKTPVELQVFNSKGQSVYTGQLQPGITLRLDKNKLSSGLYMIKMLGNGAGEMKKVLVE